MTLTPGEIKALRVRLGVSTERLGSLLGISGRTIRNWEKGVTSPPHRLALAMQQMGDQFLERVYDGHLNYCSTLVMTVFAGMNGVHQL